MASTTPSVLTVTTVADSQNTSDIIQASNNRIQYIGTRSPRVFTIAWSGSLLCSTTDGTISLGVGLNGTLVSDSLSKQKQDKTYEVAITPTVLVTLNTNDYLELWGARTNSNTAATLVGNLYMQSLDAVGNTGPTGATGSIGVTTGAYLFTRTSITTISNTAAETSLVTTGSFVGSNTLPANSLVVGDQYKFKMRGTLAGLLGLTTTFRLYFGSSTIASLSVGLSLLSSTAGLEIDGDLVVYSTGQNGQIMVYMSVSYPSAGIKVTTNFNNPQTINMTVPLTIDVRSQFGGISVSNVITASIFNIWKN